MDFTVANFDAWHESKFISDVLNRGDINYVINEKYFYSSVPLAFFDSDKTALMALLVKKRDVPSYDALRQSFDSAAMQLYWTSAGPLEFRGDCRCEFTNYVEHLIEQMDTETKKEFDKLFERVDPSLGN